MAKHSPECRANEERLNAILSEQLIQVASREDVEKKKQLTAETHIEKPFINGKFEYVNKYASYNAWNTMHLDKHLNINKYDLSLVETSDINKNISYYIYLIHVFVQGARGDIKTMQKIYKNNLDQILQIIFKTADVRYQNAFHKRKLFEIYLNIENAYITKEILFDLFMALKNIAYSIRTADEKHIASSTRIITQIYHYIQTVKIL